MTLKGTGFNARNFVIINVKVGGFGSEIERSRRKAPNIIVTEVDVAKPFEFVQLRRDVSQAVS